MGIFDQIEIPEGRSQALGAARDVTNRGIAGLLGSPVDTAALLLKPLGYDHPAPIGGSEWVGDLMAKAGMVSADRYPLPEFLMSVALPGIGTQGAKGVGLLSEGLAALGGSAGRVGPKNLQSQLGAMSPEGKARLLADLQAGKGSGTYRLGDVTPSQDQGLSGLFGRGTTGADVYMTDKATDHLLTGRVQQDGFAPLDVTRFAEQAMAKRAQPDLNPAKKQQNPSLLNSGMKDQTTGRSYDARMPLRQTENGYEVRSVVPEGLPPRNKKTPKR